mgnify:CR=1 FL=1
MKKINSERFVWTGITKKKQEQKKIRSFFKCNKQDETNKMTEYLIWSDQNWSYIHMERERETNFIYLGIIFQNFKLNPFFQFKNKFNYRGSFRQNQQLNTWKHIELMTDMKCTMFILSSNISIDQLIDRLIDNNNNKKKKEKIKFKMMAKWKLLVVVVVVFSSGWSLWIELCHQGSSIVYIINENKLLLETLNRKRIMIKWFDINHHIYDTFDSIRFEKKSKEKKNTITTKCCCWTLNKTHINDDVNAKKK